jgi:D-alanine--poly(phosphoribitol) ligase subunit 2
MENYMNNKVAEIINSVRPEIRFNSDQDTELFGVLDSLDIILIVEELEKQFGISIEAEQIMPENFASLRTLEAFVKSCAR